jgi:SNF2 family DNA or RNA helicase
MRVARRSLEAVGEAWNGAPRRRVLRHRRDSPPARRQSHRRAAPAGAASGVDWLTVSADWEAEGLRLDEADLAALRAASGPFVKLDSGWVRRDLIEEHDDAAELLADLGINLDDGEQRVSVWQLAGASEDGLAHLATLGVDAETLAAVDDLRQRIAAFTGIETVPLPAGLTATLRPYQRHGLDFLAHTSRLGLGAVLADDMGLGKTVQALAWLLHLREIDPDGGPVLVVCPASVVHNWEREASRFAPGLRVLLLTSGKERHALREEIPAHDLVVTTYALLRRDIEDWKGVPLRAAVLDEAQFIKNPDAAVARAALALDAKHRMALTGTPLENRALDLFSIMHFCNPGYLGGRAAFVRRVDRPDAPPHVRALLAAKLRPVLLRRSKGAVAPELPPRIEERRDCELTTEQRQLYLAELKKSRSLLAQITSPDRFARDKLHVLAALTRLRQICCHPALAGGRADLGSGKFDALFEMLEPLLAEGHKVLVFSQFVQCLKLLQVALKARGVRFHTLTGATTKRAEVVTAFQEDPEPSVFLISLKAGGTGLNLTAASYVVLFDPWWNPAVEAQAIDRTHRIGQDRTVIAYRMLALGTIEERIWDLQQRKATLVRDVLGEGGFSRALTRDDLEYLLADVTAV